MALFFCFLSSSGTAWAQSGLDQRNATWQPFDAATVALQSTSALALGAGMGYLGYLGMQDCPSLSCVLGAFTLPATIGGSSVAVGLVGLAMGSHSADRDFYTGLGGYWAGFTVGLLSMYPFFVEEDENGKIKYETFAVPWATGVILGTAGAVVGYNLSAETVYTPKSAGSEVSIVSGPGDLGLSIRVGF